MILQLVTLIGSLLILGGYFLNQKGYVSTSSQWYMQANMLGAIILMMVALHVQLWGYVLLNGVWAVIAYHAMYKQVMNKYRKGA